MAKVAELTVYDKVKDYYGNTVSTSDDLATNACMNDRSTMTGPVREARTMIHPEIVQK